jgi:hypothetical protein
MVPESRGLDDRHFPPHGLQIVGVSNRVVVTHHDHTGLQRLDGIFGGVALEHVHTRDVPNRLQYLRPVPLAVALEPIATVFCAADADRPITIQLPLVAFGRPMMMELVEFAPIEPPLTIAMVLGIKYLDENELILLFFILISLISFPHILYMDQFLRKKIQN